MIRAKGVVQSVQLFIDFQSFIIVFVCCAIPTTGGFGFILILHWCIFNGTCCLLLPSNNENALGLNTPSSYSFNLGSAFVF